MEPSVRAAASCAAKIRRGLLPWRTKKKKKPLSFDQCNDTTQEQLIKTATARPNRTAHAADVCLTQQAATSQAHPPAVWMDSFFTASVCICMVTKTWIYESTHSLKFVTENSLVSHNFLSRSSASSRSNLPQYIADALQLQAAKSRKCERSTRADTSEKYCSAG